MEQWRELFQYNCSPYFAMFRCGCMGISLEDCLSECQKKNIPLREKDIHSWEDGMWKHKASNQKSVLNPVLRPVTNSIRAKQSKLSDFPDRPPGLPATSKRWFPCTADNMPKGKWGYKEDFVPQLYDRATAIALSECGYVGQNMIGQDFIVVDIDGVGHGMRDELVIEFGMKYHDYTECWESPEKLGSFHLYFKTNKILPILHFNVAKLDFMGNGTNAAVYTKKKISNHLPRQELTEKIWDDIMAYTRYREELVKHDQGQFI